MHMACPGVPDVVPYGAIPPALPMLCDTLRTGVPATFTQGTNSWLDDFNHGASMATMGAGYKVFDQVEAASRVGHFRHNNHWMVDIWVPNNGVGGTMMRPDRSFKFQNGVLTVETEVAAGILEYDNMWPELIVSNASSPVGHPYGPTPGRSIGDGLYAYGQFGGYDTIGIRLAGQRPIQAYYDNTERGFPCGRVWELSWFQSGSAGGQCGQTDVASTYGGGEWIAPGYFRTCSGTDPDINCRDRFRWVLSQDRITLYVNGIKYMEHTAVAGQHLVGPNLLNGNVYVYFADWAYQPKTDRAVRFHWDRVSVNPTTAPSAAPGFVPPA
jgi:hypothetical protein